MSWKDIIIDFGKVKTGTVVEGKFKYEGDGKYVSSKPSCGCTVGDWNKETKELAVKYTPKAIPLHLKKEGKTTYNSSKYILVTMVEDGMVKNYNLQIKANIYE